MVSVGHSTRRLRRAAFLLAGSAVVLFVPLLLSLAYGSGLLYQLLYPYVNTASIYAIIVTVDVVVIVMPSIAIASLLARGSRTSLLSRRISEYRVGLLALVILLLLPAFMVALYGEWGNPFSYAVYIGFFPAGTFVAGQAVLLISSIGERLRGLSPLTLTVPALVGSLAAPGALVSYIPFGAEQPLAPVLVGLLGITAACDIALSLWLRRTSDLAAMDSPDLAT